MSTRNRNKHKGRSDKGTFTAVPHTVQDSSNWKQLGGSSLKVLLIIARQYNGNNNGDLCASFSIMRRRGIRSPDTLHRALRELRHYGMIELTRQGGLHAASLYALTWHAIDDCKGKLDVASTIIASGKWKEQRQPFNYGIKNRNATTKSVLDSYETRIDDHKKTA